MSDSSATLLVWRDSWAAAFVLVLSYLLAIGPPTPTDFNGSLNRDYVRIEPPSVTSPCTYPGWLTPPLGRKGLLTPGGDSQGWMPRLEA